MHPDRSVLVVALLLWPLPAGPALAQTTRGMSQALGGEDASGSPRILGHDLTRIDDANHPLVIAIGNAEGTRTPSGGRTAHYYGHTDPGNGVRNQGSFSAQQGYASPAAADAAWIRRLNAELPGWSRALAKLAPPGSVGHTRMLASAADLSVQAPAAVPDFIKHVAQAKATGFSWDAIAEARAKSYINPRTGRLEAAGFGNHFPSLLQDQRRRVRQLAQVLER